MVEIKDLFDLNETIAADLFKELTYPWEALPKISAFITELGEKLSSDKYDILLIQHLEFFMFGCCCE